MENRIPRIIHYCWFGGKPKPQLVLRCIESWKQFCPDYEIIEWNEDNFDTHSNAFIEDAYQAEKWAFVSDYARAIGLLRYGGIYLDTDMEALQPFDPLLVHSFFAGFETKDTIAAGIIGCEKENDVIRRYTEYYQGASFYKNGKQTMMTSPVVLTELLLEKGLKLNGKKQCASGCMVYPKNVFYPTGIEWVRGRYGSNTIAVHHYMNSWGKNSSLSEQSRISKIRLSMLFYARNLLGTETMYQMGKRIHRLKRHR